jgi:hypothetical protein
MKVFSPRLRAMGLLAALFAGPTLLPGCVPKMTVPPDQATLNACRHECDEQWKDCGGKGCDRDRTKCFDGCREFGGIRGGGRGITLSPPETSPKRWDR